MRPRNLSINESFFIVSNTLSEGLRAFQPKITNERKKKKLIEGQLNFITTILISLSFSKFEKNTIVLCLLWELNPRSPHYECDALPLGQRG